MMNLLSVFVLGHGEEHFPFHPPLVHFPIAFYFLELLLLLFWVFRHDPAYLRFAKFAFWSGFVSMLLAIATGFIDAGGLKKILKDEEVREHFIGACSVLLVYGVRALLWLRTSESAKTFKLIQVAGAVIGVAAVAVTAFLGGGLVY